MDQCLEAVAEVEAFPEVHHEVEVPFEIEVSGAVKEEEVEERASVLLEGVEEVIPISPGLALVLEDHN